MKYPVLKPLGLLLLMLLPLCGLAAPPPYWPGYPAYYYPYPASTTPNRSNSEGTATYDTTRQEPEPGNTENTQNSPSNSEPAISETSPPEPQQNTDESATTDTTIDTAGTDTAANDVIEDLTESRQEEPASVHDEESVKSESLTSSVDEVSIQTPSTEENGAETNTDPEKNFEQLAEEKLNEALSQEIAFDMQQGNFAEAYYLWRPRAEAGDADAQYGIGWMYHNGYGLAINDKEAISWWEMAARQGHVGATFALGMLYSLGEGQLRRDMEKAVVYYREAARQGHSDAKLLLRTFAANGEQHSRQLLLDQLAKGELHGIAEATQIKAKKANVRKGPGMKHKILFSAQKGLKVAAIKREGRWLLLVLEGKDFLGWIHDSLLEGKPLAED